MLKTITLLTIGIGTIFFESFQYHYYLKLSLFESDRMSWHMIYKL